MIKMSSQSSDSKFLLGKLSRRSKMTNGDLKLMHTFLLNFSLHDTINSPSIKIRTLLFQILKEKLCF